MASSRPDPSFLSRFFDTDLPSRGSSTLPPTADSNPISTAENDESGDQRLNSQICPKCGVVHGSLDSFEAPLFTTSLLRLRLLQGFGRLSLGFGRLSFAERKPDNPCQQHHQYSASSYCMTCEELVCKACTMVSHTQKGHEVVGESGEKPGSNSKNNKVVESLGLEPGDLVEFFRSSFKHWAVYIGNGKVVHRAPPPGTGIKAFSRRDTVGSSSGIMSDKAWVRMDDISDVIDKSGARKNNALDKKYSMRPQLEIVKRALSHVGDVGYNVIFNNCEHFANWCRYNEAVSQQVDSFFCNDDEHFNGSPLPMYIDKYVNQYEM